MNAQSTSDVRLLIDSETTPGYGSGAILRLAVRPVFFTDDGVRNILGDSWQPEPLADLVISAQHDHAAPTPYGWRVEYRDVFAADLRRAEIMVKTLRRIDRGLAKLRDEFGEPETFNAFMARVGSVLEIRQYGRRVEAAADFDGSGYRWMDASSAGYHLNQLAADFDREHAHA